MPRRISTGTAGGFRLGDVSLVGPSIGSARANQNLVLDANGTGDITTDAQLTLTGGEASTAFNAGGDLQVAGGMGVGGNLYVGGTVNLGGGTGFNDTAIGGTSTAVFTDLTTTSVSTLSETTEITNSKVSSVGIITHDFTEGNTWVHSIISGNFTANFTNVPTTNNRYYTMNLVMLQGATPYLANGVQIGGVTQTIRWAAYGAPTPQANRFEEVTFQLIRVGSSWEVFGSLSTHG